MAFYVYILRCNDGTYYVGHTDDLELRIAQHESGALGGYTAKRLPVQYLWSEHFPTRDEAFDAERKLKGWSRAKKEALMAGDWALVSELAKCRTGPRTGRQGSHGRRQAQAERAWESSRARSKGRAQRARKSA